MVNFQATAYNLCLANPSDNVACCSFSQNVLLHVSAVRVAHAEILTNCEGDNVGQLVNRKLHILKTLLLTVIEFCFSINSMTKSELL